MSFDEMAQDKCQVASTEPGPDDPGDRDGDRRQQQQDGGASTEPGPDDPGDVQVRTAIVLAWELQRSRGQMTPETSLCNDFNANIIKALQRSRGQMTPETANGSRLYVAQISTLQRSRGQMTPETRG